MWFWISLATAVLGSIEVIVNKKTLAHVSPALFSWALFALPLPFIFLWVLYGQDYRISSISIFAAFCSSFIFVISKTMSNHAVKNSDVSKLQPLTSFSTLFLYILALIFLGEHITFLPLVGLFIIIVGSYLLNVAKAREGLLQPFILLVKQRESGLFLLSLFMTCIAGIFDKIAIQNSSPAMTLLVESFFMTCILTPYILKREKTYLVSLKKNFWVLFGNSAIFAVISFLIFVAMSDGPLALIVAIKRLQIFFVLLISYLLLKEKVTIMTWIASIIMVIGVILIKIS